MKQRLIALALCLVMGLGLAAPSFAVQADVPGGLDGAEPALWDILAPDAPGGLTGGEETLPTPDEPAQLDTPAQNAPAEGPDLTQIGENAPAASCLYCGAAGDVHADFCPLYVPAEPAEGPGSAEDAPAPPAPARPAEPTVALETVLEQPPAQAVRTLSAEQPGVLTDDQRFLAFSTFQRPRFAESKGTDGETPEPVDNPGVETKKAVTDNKDGTYTVEIESYVTGRTITTETAAPVDIILVLDMSGQMKKADLIAMKTAANKFIEMASSEQGERRIALVTYQNTTSKVISGNGEADESALVKVTRNDGETTLKNAVTALSTPSGDAFCQYGLARAVQIFQSYKKSAPRYVILLSAGVFGEEGKKLREKTSENAAQVAINVSTVLKTSPQGATPNVKWGQNFYGGQAMDKTHTQDNLKKDQDLTISFDAGVYASDSIISGGGCDAEVYCVGLNMPVQKKDGKAFGDLEYSDTSPRNGVTKEDSENMAGYGNTAARINEAMYRICSDRRDSTHVTSDTLYQPWEKAAFLVGNSSQKATYYTWTRKWDYYYGYYYAWNSVKHGQGAIKWDGTYPDWATRNMPNGHFLTGDTETIEERFNTIFANIQSANPAPSVTLDKNSVLIDVVMPYFEVPEGTSDIKAKVVDVAGQEDADLSAELEVIYKPDHVNGTSSVSVKGFDYTGNFVNEKDKTGKKLVLTFTIQPIQGFMGGNGVPTNNVTQSGVFAEGKLVENLPDPGTKNVPLADIKLTVPDKSIYLSQTLTEAKLLEGAVVTLEGDNKPLPLTEEAQKDDWRFDFVTLTVAADASYTGEWTDCTKVPVTATLAAKDDVRNTSSATAEPTVHVFRPTVSVAANDVWADYGVKIDLEKWCVDEQFTTDWACKDKQTAVLPAKPAPAISDLAYTFVLGTIGFYSTAEVDATGKITGLSYTVGGNAYTDLAWAVEYPESGDHFTIHINRFDLNVSKTWDGADCYKQSAIFNLSTENGQAMATQFTLSPETGKSSTTVHGLVCGKTYALSEDMDWSWRYNSNPSGAVTVEKHNEISKTAPTIDPARLSFTNTLEKSFWFDAASFVSNLFKGKVA